MRTVARTLLLAFTAVALLIASGASAETYPLTAIGMRFETLPGEICVTDETPAQTAAELIGIGSEAAFEAMRGSGFGMAVRSEGRLVTLSVAEMPQSISAYDICELNAAERGKLLDYMARRAPVNEAKWLDDMPDYAMLKCAYAGDMAVNSLTVFTLYLGKIYSFSFDAVGRELTAEDEAALKSIASRALRLGLGAQTAAMEIAPLSDANAEMMLSGDDIRLTAASVPTVIGSVQLTVSGETEPGAKMRVKVNGSASESFYPDENGAYYYTVRKLKNGQENSVEIIASRDGKTASIAFKVAVRQQRVPLAVTPLTGVSQENTITIKGSTMPGAKISAVKGNSGVDIAVDDNGLFSFELNTKKAGSNYRFTVKADCSGYKSGELEGRIRRIDLKEAETAAARLDYQALLNKPKKFDGTCVCMEGRITAFGYQNGTPMCLIASEDGSEYLLRCQTTDGLFEGQVIRFIGTLCGDNEALGADAREYPEIALEALLDNGD